MGRSHTRDVNLSLSKEYNPKTRKSINSTNDLEGM